MLSTTRGSISTYNLLAHAKRNMAELRDSCSPVVRAGFSCLMPGSKWFPSESFPFEKKAKNKHSSCLRKSRSAAKVKFSVSEYWSGRISLGHGRLPSCAEGSKMYRRSTPWKICYQLVVVHEPIYVHNPNKELSPEVSRSRFKWITQHFWRGRVQIHTLQEEHKKRITQHCIENFQDPRQRTCTVANRKNI